MAFFTEKEFLSNKTLLMATGLSDEDVQRPLIGIANSYSEAVPGHVNLRRLAEKVKYGIYRAGGTPVEFGTIATCDGVTDGHEGCRYALPSRELIADSVELMAQANRFDGLVLLGACDKIVPGMLMASLRLDIPTIFVAGGPSLGGVPFAGKERADSTSVAEGMGMHAAGLLSEEALQALPCAICPTIGSCQHMATANTMCALTEVLGLSLPGSAAIPAVYNERERAAMRSGEAIVALVQDGIGSRRIVTPGALDNAIKFLLAVGGSTNAVIHLAALAHELGISPAYVMERLDVWSKTIPQLVRISPASKVYDAEDFYKAGGVPEVMRQLAPLQDMTCQTVAGMSWQEAIQQRYSPYPENKEVIRPLEAPFADNGGLVVLRGNLAPETAVAKPAAVAREMLFFTGRAVCFDTEADCLEAIRNGGIVQGDVVVIRYVGPKGAPGMPEMFQPLKMMNGYGLDTTTAMLTDGRFSGTNNGLFIGHISPEAAAGGPLALVQNGDGICIDIINRRVDLLIDPATMAARRAAWQYEAPHLKGYLKRYATHVTSAANGAVLDDR